MKSTCDTSNSNNSSDVLVIRESFNRLNNGIGSLQDMQNILGDQEVKDIVATLNRHDLLPHLFSIRGEPYTIEDYPQFQPLYSKNMPANMVYKCGRQIAKTTNISRSEIIDCLQIPNFQILYVAPLQSQAYRYSSLYLHEAISTCSLAKALQDKKSVLHEDRGPILKSVAHQAFSNGAGIQMLYAKTSADRARGVTADRCDFDEVQDQLIDNIPIIGESLTNSSWALQRFTGTAKTTDNPIEHYWRQSSMGEWAVKCTGCNHWNIPDLDHDVLKMIQVHGPSCVKCGKRLNVRNGEFIHAKPHLVDEFMGVHIPQVVVPAITENPVKWHKLVDKVNKYPESLIYTEILGISYDSGARLISQEDIDKACVLGSVVNLRQNLGNYVHRIVGVDWGVAEISSFTVSTVLGLTPNGEIHILFAKRYVGQNIESVLEDISQTFNAYQCDAIAADYGMGYTNNQILSNKGIPVSQVQYVKANTLLTWKSDNNSPRWMADRNTSLSLIFWAIKYGKIAFPCKEDIQDYTCDLLSPFEEYKETSSGMRTKYFQRNPSMPDDFCHALTFGSLILLRMANSSMLDLVPSHALNTKGNSFPEFDNLDKDAVLASIASL